MKRRGPYQKRIDKLVRILSARHPDLPAVEIEDCIRAAWIDDITDASYVAEVEHKIRFQMKSEETTRPG
jgi:hypothetical protein